MALHDPGKNRRSAEETEDETARKKFKLEDNMEKFYSNYSHYVNAFNELLMLTESQEPGVFRILHGQVALTKVCLDECGDYMSKKFCKSIELTPNEPSSEAISSDLVPSLSNNGGPVVCVPRVNVNEEKANLPILSRVKSESTSISNTWRSKKSFRKKRLGPASSKLKLTVKNVEAHNEYQEPFLYAFKRKVQPLSESGSSHSVRSLNSKEIATVQDFSVQLSGKSPQIKLFKVDSKHDSSNASIEQPQMGTNPRKTTNEESCNKNDLNDNHLNLNSRTNRISSSSRTDDESIFLKPQKVATEEITKSVSKCQGIFNGSSHCSSNKVTNRKMKKSVKQDSSLHSANSSVMQILDRKKSTPKRMSSDPKDNETRSIEPACGDARKEILSIDNSCSEETSSLKSKSSALKSLSSSEISESDAVNNAVDKNKIPFLGNEESELFTENDSKDLAREKEDVPILLEVNAPKNYKTVELSTLKDDDCFSISHFNDIDSAALTNLRSTPKSRISKLNRKHCHLNSGESKKGKAKSKTGEKVVEIGQSLLSEETVAQPEQIKKIKCDETRKTRNSSFGILSPETKLPLPSFPQNSSSGDITNEKNFSSDRLEHESAPLVTINVEKCSSNVKDKPSNCSEEKKTKIESSGHGPCKRSRKKSDNLNAGNTPEKCSNDEWKVRAASPDNMILKIGKTQIDSAAVEFKHRQIDEITTPDSKGRSCNDSVKIEEDHKTIESQQKSDKSKISEKIKIKLKEKSVKPSTSKNEKKIDLRKEGKKITSITGIQPLTSNKKRKIDPAYGGKKITPEIATKPETPKNEKKIDKKITSEKAIKPDQEQAKTSYQMSTLNKKRKMNLENVGKKITPETARLAPQKGLENTEKTIPTRSQIERNKSETVKEERTVSESIARADKMKSRRNTTDEEYQEILKHVEEVLESVVANVDAFKESEPKKSALKQLEDELQISTSSSDASSSDSSKCTTCSSSDSSLSSIENNQSGHDDISTSQVKPSNEPKINNSKAISSSLTNFQIPKIKCQPREQEVIGPKQTFTSVGKERIDVLKQVEPESHPRTERSLPLNAKAMNEKLKLSLRKRLKPKEKIQGSSNAVPPVSKTDKEVQEKTELKPAPSSIIKNCDSLNAAPSASIMNDPADDFISLTVSDEELDNLDVASSRYSSHLSDLEPKKSSRREKISSSLVAASSHISLSTEPGPPHSSCDGRNSSSENSRLARVKRSKSVDRKLEFSPERVDSGHLSSTKSNPTSESSAPFQEGSRQSRVERSRSEDSKLEFSPERVDSGPSCSTKSNPTSESSASFQEGSRQSRIERSRSVDSKLEFSPERVDSGPSCSTKSNPTSESSALFQEGSRLPRVERSRRVDRKLNFSPERVDSDPSSSTKSNLTSESSALFQEGSRLSRVERSKRVDRKLNFSPERVDSGPSSSTKSNPTSESSVPHRNRRDSISTSSQLATQSNDLLYNPLFEIKQMERKSMLFSEQVKIITRLLCCSLLTAKHPPDIIQSETLARIGSFIRNQHDAEPSKYIKEIVNYANRPGSHDEGTKIGTLMYPLKIVVTNLMAWKYVEKDFSEVYSLYENFAVALDVDIFSNPPQIEPIKGKKYSGSWFAIAVIDVFTKNKKHNPCALVMRRLNLYNLNRNEWKWSNTKDDENFHQCILTRLFKALMERKKDKQEEKDSFENALKHLALLVITNSRDEQCESDFIEVLHLDINDMFVKFFEVKLFDECQKLSRTLPELILLKLDKSIWRGLVFAAVKASKTQKDEDYAVSLLQLAAEYEIYPHLLAKGVTKDLVVPVPLHLIQEEVKPYIEFYFRNRLVKIVHDESLEVLRNPEEASLTLKIEAFKIKTKYSLPFLNDSMQIEDKVATMQKNIIQILQNFGISANRTELGIVSVNYRSFLAYINSIPPDVVSALTV